MKLPKVTSQFFKPSIPSCSNNYKICIFFFSIIKDRRYSWNRSSNYISSYFSFKTFYFCLIYNLAKLFFASFLYFLNYSGGTTPKITEGPPYRILDGTTDKIIRSELFFMDILIVQFWLLNDFTFPIRVLHFGNYLVLITDSHFSNNKLY